MSGIKEITEAYDKLPLSDRIMFYLCISNDLTVSDENKQSFLIEHRQIDHECIHCGSSHVVKNGHRDDGTQRFLCRNCRKSFVPSLMFRIKEIILTAKTLLCQELHTNVVTIFM